MPGALRYTTDCLTGIRHWRWYDRVGLPELPRLIGPCSRAAALALPLLAAPGAAGPAYVAPASLPWIGAPGWVAAASLPFEQQGGHGVATPPLLPSYGQENSPTPVPTPGGLLCVLPALMLLALLKRKNGGQRRGSRLCAGRAHQPMRST